jgi:hypothetical protein
VRRVATAAGGCAIGVALLAGAYGLWLLTTLEDSDGGRRFVGLVMVGSAALVALAAILLVYVTHRARA